MISSLTLMIVSGVLITAGGYLMMERSLTRILVGVLLAGNGVNLLFLIASGRPGGAPFIDTDRGRDISDPLPQAMVLTAIVISLATIGFLLALSYRLWQISGTDDVPDDAEDARIQRRAELDEVSETYDPSQVSTTTSDELTAADERHEASEAAR